MFRTGVFMHTRYLSVGQDKMYLFTINYMTSNDLVENVSINILKHSHVSLAMPKKHRIIKRTLIDRNVLSGLAYDFGRSYQVTFILNPGNQSAHAVS